MTAELNERVASFVRNVCTAMGLDLAATIDTSDDNIRIELSGDGAEPLLRRKGEALDALQHLVNTAFRRELEGDHHFVVDCLSFRKSHDEELRQMARFLMEKAKHSGVAQEMGPLNPYARRLVHIEVTKDSDLTSESIGDAFLKTVIISRRKP